MERMQRFWFWINSMPQDQRSIISQIIVLGSALGSEIARGKRLQEALKRSEDKRRALIEHIELLKQSDETPPLLVVNDNGAYQCEL